MKKRSVGGDSENDSLYYGELAKDSSSSSSSSLIVADNSTSGALVAVDKSQELVNVRTRTSPLSSPNLLLTGHEKAIFSISFDSKGENLCSAGADNSIFLWEVFGDCKNYNVLKGHKNAVIGARWLSNQPQIVSCSADTTCALWDANKGLRLRKFEDHSSIVNCIATARDNGNIFGSGSDDCCGKIWDIRHKRAAFTFGHDYQVTAACLSHDGQYMYTGGIDNIIRRWDMRMDTDVPEMELPGHRDTVTGLSINPDGTVLLSNSMDRSLKTWNLQPFCQSESSTADKDPRIQSHRCMNTLPEVAFHGAEKNLLGVSWSCDGNWFTCGSAQGVISVFEAQTGKMIYYLGGHQGSVNDVAFHPVYSTILASAGTDRKIFLGELADA